MGERETLQRVATPTAILIALEEPLASRCTDILADGRLRVLRVSHVAAACERIPVVMPQLVLVPTTLSEEDTTMLTDRCIAVGAEIFQIAPEAEPAGFKERLVNASKIAFVRALRRR